MEQQNNGHGGARKGAGRKPNDRNIPLSVRISPQAARCLDGVRNKSEYIDELIINNDKTNK